MTNVARAMTVIGAGLIAVSSLHALPGSAQYDCTAKGKKGAGDAASVVSADSESGAVAAMQKRWPGYATYSCKPRR